MEKKILPESAEALALLQKTVIAGNYSPRSIAPERHLFIQLHMKIPDRINIKKKFKKMNLGLYCPKITKSAEGFFRCRSNDANFLFFTQSGRIFLAGFSACD